MTLGFLLQQALKNFLNALFLATDSDLSIKAVKGHIVIMNRNQHFVECL